MKIAMASASEMRTDARVCREAETLSRAGYEVTVGSLGPGDPEKIDGVEIVELEPVRGPRAFRLVGNLARLTFWFIRARADVYHAHNVHMLPAGWVAARVRRKPLVYDAHELFSVRAPTFKQRLERGTERLFAPRADLRLTASARYAAQIGEALGIAPPIVVANYPVLPPAGLTSPLRAASGAGDDDIVVLYQGGYYTETRALDVVVESMRHLPAHYRLVLLGFGVNGEEEVLAAQIRDLGLRDRVKMIPSVPHRDLAAWTVGADVGVIPFRLTSLAMKLCSPNKLYEYLAAGIAVLATGADELREVLDETGAGRIYDADDPVDLATQLQALGPDRAALHAIGASGRVAAEQRYSWEAAEQNLLDAYRELRG